jgi:AcrR family transcriptional regulator
MSIHSEPRQAGDAERLVEEPEVKRRADAERNLGRIIEAATALLAVNPGASMAEIAEASGLVRATLYRHFPTRYDLLREIYSAALEDALAAILSVDPERGKATDAIARVVDALLVVGDRYRILSEERPRSPELIQQ